LIHVQRRPPTIPRLLLLAWVCTSCSNEIRPSDVIVEGISEHENCEHLYFRLAEGVRCAGVEIREVGTRRMISFLEEDSLRVDATASPAVEYPWAGNWCVKIPIDQAMRENGGEMTLVLEGRGESIELGTMTYPAGRRSGR